MPVFPRLACMQTVQDWRCKMSVPLLYSDEPAVTHVRVVVKKSRQAGDGEWQTVEVQASAQIQDPERWREEMRNLLAALDREAEDYLRQAAEAVPIRAPIRSHTHNGNGNGNGNGKNGNSRPWDAFWRAAYAAGLTREEGQEILRRARGDFALALTMLS